MSLESLFRKFDMPPKERGEEAEPVKGDNFVMERQERKPGRGPHDTSVEFRPGESTDKVAKEKAERTKNFTPADWAEKDFADILKNQNQYSETLRITRDGRFDETSSFHGSARSLMEADTPNELYQIAAEIEKKHPEFHFSFETDPEGKWMKYTVSKTESVK